MKFLKKYRKFIIIIAVAIVLIAAGVTTAIALQPKPEPPKPVAERPVEQEILEEPDPVWPLTGLPISDESLMYNRPLSVKIENSQDARPQLGIGSADVVYETLTEGGITRFNCIFHSTLPDDVGPVRSARNSDLTVVPEYQGILFFSGANGLVVSQMNAAGLNTLTEGQAMDVFHRVDFKAAPHNLYLALGGAYNSAAGAGIDIHTDNPPTLEFLEEDMTTSNTSAIPASAITVPFSDAFVANWNWDSGANLYYRSMDGPTLDAANDQQIGVANVVVIWSLYTPDNAGGTTLEVHLDGTSQAMVFTGGKWIQGTWESDGQTPPRFKDASGVPILLTPGQTWFSVVQEGTEIFTS